MKASSTPHLQPESAIGVVAEAVGRSTVLGFALTSLRRAGGRPLVVGGSVRDAFLGASPKDIDIEVHGIEPEELFDVLQSVGPVIEVGASFAVLKLRVEDGSEIDFSLPRRDRKTGPRHDDFEVEIDTGMDIAEAAARRDFTINAMAFDLDARQLIDPHGGLDDLRTGVLRHTSAAFTEDPLRVLRGAQFAGRFDMSMHPDTVSLSADIVDEFRHLSVERVWGEFNKVFRFAKFPSRALAVLIATGWVTHFPELDAIVGVPQDAIWHPEGPVEVHSGLSADAAVEVANRAGLSDDDRAFVVCATLLHDVGKATHTQVRPDGRVTAHGHADAGVAPAASFLARIGAPANLIERVLPVIREHMCCVSTEQPSAAAVRRLARRLAPASVLDWSYVVEADNRGRAQASREGCAGPWLALAHEHGVTNRPVKPLLRGQHLIDAGLTPGPTFRAHLDAATDAQEAGEITDEAQAVAWLTERLERMKRE